MYMHAFKLKLHISLFVVELIVYGFNVLFPPLTISTDVQSVQFLLLLNVLIVKNL